MNKKKGGKEMFRRSPGEGLSPEKKEKKGEGTAKVFFRGRNFSKTGGGRKPAPGSGVFPI